MKGIPEIANIVMHKGTAQNCPPSSHNLPKIYLWDLYNLRTHDMIT
jgi:hypothetical protein